MLYTRLCSARTLPCKYSIVVHSLSLSVINDPTPFNYRYGISVESVVNQINFYLIEIQNYVFVQLLFVIFITIIVMCDYIFYSTYTISAKCNKTLL